VTTDLKQGPAAAVNDGRDEAEADRSKRARTDAVQSAVALERECA
jgi:hypothetical protein